MECDGQHTVSSVMMHRGGYTAFDSALCHGGAPGYMPALHRGESLGTISRVESDGVYIISSVAWFVHGGSGLHLEKKLNQQTGDAAD